MDTQTTEHEDKKLLLNVGFPLPLTSPRVSEERNIQKHRIDQTRFEAVPSITNGQPYFYYSKVINQ
jgi:hypothetical protein